MEHLYLVFFGWGNITQRASCAGTATLFIFTVQLAMAVDKLVYFTRRQAKQWHATAYMGAYSILYCKYQGRGKRRYLRRLEQVLPQWNGETLANWKKPRGGRLAGRLEVLTSTRKKVELGMYFKSGEEGSTVATACG